MDDAERQRYSRQIRLPELGEAGQQRLLDSRVLVIGMGGLGSPVALYLAAAGVGHLVLSDYDWVDTSNLQRQIAHRAADIGESKAASAARSATALNPRTRVDALDYELDGEDLDAQVAAADLVVDCTDNFPSRFTLNRVAWAHARPLVSGAAIRWQGQVAVFTSLRPEAGCYACLYPDESVEAATCAAEGVIAPLVGVIGSVQALLGLRVLLGEAGDLAGRLMLFDALGMEWVTVPLVRRPGCAVCAATAPTAERAVSTTPSLF